MPHKHAHAFLLDDNSSRPWQCAICLEERSHEVHRYSYPAWLFDLRYREMQKGGDHAKVQSQGQGEG
jgi:hypothetical protein